MELLVIGAGPYGLAVAAEARRQGLSVTVVGEPMRFWRRNMPDGMLLRSGREWHLDAAGVNTFDAFVGGWGGEPIPVGTFIAYADWFCEHEAACGCSCGILQDAAASVGRGACVSPAR